MGGHYPKKGKSACVSFCVTSPSTRTCFPFHSKLFRSSIMLSPLYTNARLCVNSFSSNCFQNFSWTSKLAPKLAFNLRGSQPSPIGHGNAHITIMDLIFEKVSSTLTHKLTHADFPFFGEGPPHFF